MSESISYNIDCLEYMRGLPDKHFDLCIADPPYNIPRLQNPHGRLERYGDTRKANNNAPTKETLNEMFRVSKNLIIWGGNYIEGLPPCRCFIAWYKHQPVENYSDCEYAWTSFNKPARVFDYPYYGFVGRDEVKIHTTQKPIALYKWTLERFADKGNRIFDPYLGSGSSRIAAYDMGLDFIGCEIDKEHFDKQEARFNNYTAQLRLDV